MFNLKIRTEGTGYEIQVQVDVVCQNDTSNDLITQLIIWPNMKSEQFSKGLCRSWSNPFREISNIDDENYGIQIEEPEPDEVENLDEIM